MIAVLTMPLCTTAFMEEILRQMGGGGGGGHTFHFGGGMPQQRSIWPKGLKGEIDEQFNWLKGTTWEWNKWRNVQFKADGNFVAPTRECQGNQCKWCTQKNKIYVHWGQAGLHVLKAKRSVPEEGNYLYGKRRRDGDKVKATFVAKEEVEEELDPYEILGLDFDATDRQVKKAFRRMSIKYHPDKDPSEEAAKQFELARKANDVLSDPDKRILYDTGGMEAVIQHEQSEQQRESGQGQMNPFAAFFGGQQQEQRQANKGPDSKMQLTVELKDLYNGHAVEASLTRRIVCRGCRKRPDRESCQRCSRCPPEQKVQMVQMGPGMMVQQQVQVPSKEKCRQEQTKLDVVVEKGMKEGDVVTFERMAEQTPGQIPGDVIFVLKERRDRVFEREGDNLKMTLNVSLKEALLGFAKTVTHMDGHTFVVEKRGVTVPNEVIQIKEEGMPVHNFPSQRGMLYVTVNVEFPREMTAAQTEAIEAIFPA
jgi:DnaJ-class molecular chaperone